MFVAVEGIEGSGKSTLLAGLNAHFTAAGSDVLVTREPGGTPVGEAVRAIFLDRSVRIDPLTEALLVSAARSSHVRERVRPALEAGRIVITDRFVDSTLAYQGYGRGLDLSLLRNLCAIATEGLQADLTFVVDVPVDVSRERIRRRDRIADRLELEDDAFHERVRQGYLEIARSAGHLVLDGTLPPAGVVSGALRAIERVAFLAAES